MDALPVILDALDGTLHRSVVLPGREAGHGPFPDGLHPRTLERLHAIGVDSLYSHQAEAVQAATIRKNVVVATGTGSGKSLCFLLPLIESLLREPVARALLVYPTKALAQDQAQKIEAILPEGFRCAVYDGDTPKSHRAAARKSAHVILTNPDMLHVGILPYPESWRPFWRSLRMVALDEAHTYRGIFGSHVGLVMRRLRRMCDWMNNTPQFVLTSATMADPLRTAHDLTGLPFEAVTEDGGPQGKRTLVTVPNVLDGPSPNALTSHLLARLSARGIRTLAFGRSRPSVELMARSAKRALKDARLHPEIVEPYRAGYTPKERREIEKQLFEGRLVGLAATSAMELGIDVGELACVLVNGYPGAVSRFWQQAGRAGRAGKEAVVVYVAHADALENLLAEEPDRLVDGALEQGVLKLDNPYVAAGQLRCAAYERPVAEEELEMLGPGAAQAVETLVESGLAVQARGLLIVPDHLSPARNIGLRSAESDSVSLSLGGSVLGEMERWRAMREAHPGAVYLHRAQPYLVRELDLAHGTAHVEPTEVPYFTRPIVQTLVLSKVELEQDGRWRLDAVQVTTSVVGYRRLSLEGAELLAEEPLQLPPHELDTLGARLDLGGLGPCASPEAVHALEHCLAAVAPLATGCDKNDVSTAWAVVAPDTLEPVVYVLDTVPGGTGIAEDAYRRRANLLESGLALLEACECLDGCPKCLLSPQCEAGNAGLDKPGAVALLMSLQVQNS